MAATRRVPSLQIFQDPIDTTDDLSIAHGLPSPSILIDHNSSENMTFNPSYSIPTGLSPIKHSQNSSSPHARALADKTNFNAVVIPPPHFGFVSDSPMKRPMAPYDGSFPGLAMSGSIPPGSYSMMDPMGKENVPQAPVVQAKSMMAGTTSTQKKPSHKRKLTDSTPLAPSNGHGGNKKQKTSDEPVILPAPEDMPTVDDDGAKPPYSYAQLIGMAILRAPNRRLTLASIYSWIAKTFSYYNVGDAGWQNSIRHNLSLNKAFTKQDRPKEDPGKGSYWVIVSGMEGQFMKEKNRRPPPPDGFVLQSGSEGHRPSTSSSSAHFTESLKRLDSSKYPEDTELSSDATIPASDPDIHDGIDPELAMPPPPTRHMRSSPPPADIRSSPPPAPEREDTPPRQVHAHPSSRPSGGRKRKFAGLGDSGYYSSIESSVTRNGHVRFSDADHEHPAMKRGRAEEEIRRMRSSSIDLSPLKSGNSRLDLGIPTSSPFKTVDALKTPAVVFKKPARPPMSASPNTSLRNHRAHVKETYYGSPDKKLPVNFSSPFNFGNLELPNPHFELFADEESSAFGHVFDDNFNKWSSPLKSAGRPRLDRSLTMNDAPLDLWSPAKSRLGSPFGSGQGKSKSDFQNKLLGSPVRIVSPVKRSSITGPPSTSTPNTTLPHIPEDDELMFAAVNLPSDDSEPGVDLTQDFQKIGAHVPHTANQPMSQYLGAPDANWMRAQGSPIRPPTNRSGRPPLARSVTNRF